MSGRPDTDHVSRRPCVSVAVVCLYVGVVIGTARACPQRFLTSPNGTVESPGFPDTLKEKVRCKWTISAEPGYVILFTFDVWEVGLETDVSLPCDSNGVTAFVNMYDGETTADIKLLGRYCARKRKPGIITTTGNHLTVVFTIRNTVRNVDWVDIPVHKFNASYTSRKSDDPPEEQIGLFAYGPNADDVKLGENMSLSEPIDLSMEGPSIIPVHAGIPVGDVRANRAQVHADGRVSFYGEDETTTARNYVCVYCTQIDHSAHDAGVWYNTQVSCADPQNTERCEKANADVKVYANDDTFKAHVALVATWQNVEHGKRHHVGEATFQVAVVSNFSVTYAMVYYKSGAMGWQKGAVSATDIHTGTALFSNGTTLFHHMMYSNTTEVLFLDLLKGNTGRRGTYLYKLGDVSSSPEDECRSWYQRNKNLSAERERGFAKLPDCPCTDWRIEGNGDWVHSPTRERSRGDCYRLSKAKSRYLLPYGKLCCYENGRLLLDTRDAGSCTAYNPAYPSLYADYLREDKLAHRACCDRTSSTELCDAFYELRPKGQCVDRTLFRSSWLFGDPHIVTLDEKDYVFNGWGEYTMVTLNTTDVNFVLQGRTDLAETENGTLTNATVFTAFGAEENGVGVFVGLDAGNKSSLVLYADGTDYSVQFRNNRDFFVDSEHFQLAKDNDDLYISFPSWAHIGVSMRFKSLAVSVSLPLTFQGQTQGLLGNFNREKEDDMALPDGTVLPNNLTERQIFEQLGKKWQVSESDSVMRYGPREGPANYTHPDFYPIFLDEQPADVIQEAEAACVSSNLACIYDYVATGSSTFALDSKQVKIEAEETNTLIKNTVPHVQVPATLNVTSGAEVTFTLQGHDPDTNDLVTYHVEDDGNGTVQIDSQTGLVTFTPDALQPSVFRFFVMDSHNVQSPARSPIIIMCSGCSGHGSCDYSRYSFTDRGNNNFQFAACVCEPAWDGPDCESDRDACAGSPCLEQQTCTDLTPDQQGSRSVGYDCGPCPEGYSTDPVSQNCVDVDECLELTTNSCEMVCFNTEGSYECACDAGYRLDSNGHTCWDVNECQEKTDNCEQICSNTLGGYVCLCEEGYTLDDSAATCSQKEDSVSLCRNAGCSHGCRKLADQSSADSVPKCFCRPGYDLDLTDNKTCWDHDECRDGVCSQQCYNFVGGFACYCHNGYRLSDDGRTCDPCPPMRYGPDCQLTCTCGGRGRGCHPVRGCVCEDGWTGVYCEEDVDECSQIPSVCGGDQLCTNTRGSYTCSCLDGYRLNLTDTCEDIDECEEDSVLNTCDSLEQCMNVPGSFYCECSGGYRRANNTCADIDECASNKNDCEQICVNVPGTYNCGCYYGYRLNTDRVTCSLVSDVCKEQGLNCTHGCTLSDVSDRAVCFCRTGYQLGGDLQTCVDIDECTAGTSGCSHTCSNTDGGFLCSCPLGMKLDNDGETCLDCPTGTYGKGCTDTCACGLGSDRCDVTSGCVCKSGWQGDSCDTDVNECGSTSVQQECQNMNARCVNYPGGYMCQCQDGYTNSSAGVCQDIDECKLNVCEQQCENLPGSYRCLCYKGFNLNSHTGVCEDINECSLTATNNCSQRCVNTVGSYLCTCDVPGYTLQLNGITCTATASCQRQDCPAVNGGCSQEKCFCNSGYILTTNNTCQLTGGTWCAVNQCGHYCEESADGKSFCSCRPGHLLHIDGTSCEECPVNRYGPDCNDTCTCNTRNSESCSSLTGACKCKAGWEGPTCSDDTDECSAPSGVTCPDNSRCINTKGSYYCTCKTGFLVDANGKCVQLEHVTVTCMVQGVAVAEAVLSDVNSQLFSFWNHSMSDALINMLQPEVGGLVSVRVLSLSGGESLVVEVELVLNMTDHPDAVKELAVVLHSMAGASVSVGGQTGTLDVFINGSKVQSSWTPCAVYVIIQPCPERQECIMGEKVLECSSIVNGQDVSEDTEEDHTMPIALGTTLAVIVIVIAVAVVIYFLKCKAPDKSDYIKRFDVEATTGSTAPPHTNLTAHKNISPPVERGTPPEHATLNSSLTSHIKVSHFPPVEGSGKPPSDTNFSGNGASGNSGSRPASASSVSWISPEFDVTPSAANPKQDWWLADQSAGSNGRPTSANSTDGLPVPWANVPQLMAPNFTGIPMAQSPTGGFPQASSGGKPVVREAFGEDQELVGPSTGHKGSGLTVVHSTQSGDVTVSLKGEKKTKKQENGKAKRNKEQRETKKRK